MPDKPITEEPFYRTEYRQEKWYEQIPFCDESFPIRMLLNMESRPPEPATWHEQIEFLYVLDGHLICECDFVHYLCGPGDVVIINPCETHVIYQFEKPALYHCILADPRLLGQRDDLHVRKYMDAYTERRIRFNNSIRTATQAAAILDDLIEAYTRKAAGYELAVKGNLLRLLALLFRYEVSMDETPRKKRGYESLAPALRYITENYVSDITLADLAAQCCMNRSYFCRQFHEIIGKTAISYINEYRLSKAKALLLTSSQSISEIAVATGFSDNSYFTRKFKEHYGVSPSVMRRCAPASPILNEIMKGK